MSPQRSALVLAAMALLSLLSASLFHETLSASIEVETGYIKVRIQDAEVEEGRNVCTIQGWDDTVVYVQLNGQRGDACLIKVIAQNDGTVPARLRAANVISVGIRVIPQNNGTVPAQPSGVRVYSEYPVKGEVVVDGPVLPGRSGTVKFRLRFLEDYQSSIDRVWLTFVMGPP